VGVSARNSPGRGWFRVHYGSDVTSQAGDGAESTATRVVVVPPERLVGWTERFGERHGPV